MQFLQIEQMHLAGHAISEAEFQPSEMSEISN